MLQTLDVSINKLLKSKIRSKYIKYFLEQNNCSAKVSQEDIISWTEETWYNHKISTEIVNKSFKKLELLWISMEEKMNCLLGTKKLLEDDQEMVEEIKQKNKNKLFNVLHTFL